MPTVNSNTSLLWLLLVAMLLLGAANEVGAAGVTVMNLDRNLLIRVQDTLVDGKRTQLLYYTVPDVTQGHASEPCTVNFYVLNLRRGLAKTQPKLLAENYCGAAGISGTLLSNGNIVIIAGDHVEAWRPGKGKISAWKFSDVAALQGKWPNINDGNTPLAVSHDGNMVFARDLPRQRNDTITASGIIAGLTADGALRWQLDLEVPGELLDIRQTWSTPDGGALLLVDARPLTGAGLPGVKAPAGAMVTDQQRLYRVSASGELSAPVILASSQQPDFAHPAPLPDMHKDPAGFQAAFARQQQLSNLESIGQVAARPRDEDVMDVLLRRASNDEHRDGTFLYRIDREGGVMLTAALTASMNVDGLDHWTDFSASRDQVILYGVIGTRENRLPQGYVSWIDIPDDGIVTHLVPLSTLGLEAAKMARDEEMQSLVDNPSQDPQLLSSLAGKPLTVSLVLRSQRPAIQLDESLVNGPNALEIYTEARDTRLARAAEEQRRKQRQAEQEAHHQELNDELAAAVDVTPAEFAAMSNRERKEAMLRKGDLNAIMAATQKQMERVPQANDNQLPSASSTDDMHAQVAAAIAQAQQAMTTLSKSMPDMMPAISDTQEDEVIMLDEHHRGLVKFHHPDGDAVTLLISNRLTGEELLKNSYPDGTVLEYIDFSRFDLPLDSIKVVYQAEDKKVLGNPALKINN